MMLTLPRGDLVAWLGGRSVSAEAGLEVIPGECAHRGLRGLLDRPTKDDKGPFILWPPMLLPSDFVT